MTYVLKLHIFPEEEAKLTYQPCTLLTISKQFQKAGTNFPGYVTKIGKFPITPFLHVVTWKKNPKMFYVR